MKSPARSQNKKKRAHMNYAEKKEKTLNFQQIHEAVMLNATVF